MRKVRVSIHVLLFVIPFAGCLFFLFVLIHQPALGTWRPLKSCGVEGDAFGPGSLRPKICLWSVWKT